MQTITITVDQIEAEVIGLAELRNPAGAGEPVLIPLLDPPAFDERQACHLAHEYLAAHDYDLQPDVAAYAAGYMQLAAADLPAYRTCRSYRAGRCGGNGYRSLCLFKEPPDSAGWVRTRQWRRLPNGAICPADTYAEHLADARAWPAAKPWADLVASSFGIAIDAAGAVLADRPITTTVDELSLALAWCLALVGCDESQLPGILETWAPQADPADPNAEIKLPASMIYGALSTAALYGVRLAESEVRSW